MGMIRLAKISERDWQAVCALSVKDGQTKFVAYNSYSLAQACYEAGSSAVSVYCDDELVGFVMTQEKDGEVWIVRLMIDQRHQGRGYGRETMFQLCQRFSSKRLMTSYVPDNDIAANLYRSLGFVATGAIEDGEVVVKKEPTQ